MKAVLSGITASTVGLSCVFAGAIQASDVKTSLMAQVRSPRLTMDEDREPIDRSQAKDGSGKNTWIPMGFNKDRVAVFWGRVSTYKPLNENSFRIQVQYLAKNGNRMEGRMDLNCKNKDFYIRPNGVSAQNSPWAVIAKGSGVETAAKFFCRRTSAKAEWGYINSTKFLWNAPAPRKPAAEANGDWILYFDRPTSQAYYNNAVIKEENVVSFAMWSETIKGDMSTDNQDIQRYDWVRASCEKNIGSIWFVLDPSVEGIWLPPTAGRPGGAVMKVRKQFCKK